MSLDEKLWVFGYKVGSRSAIALADALDVWCLKHEGSTWRGSPDRIVLNWGGGTGCFNAKTGGAKVWNTPQQIDLAVNKLDFMIGMRGDNAPRLPFWTSRHDQARAWVSSGLTLVGRKVVEGAKGEGIVLIKSPLDFVECKLYTVKVESIEEFRVYMFNGKVIDGRTKELEEGQEADPDNMRFQEDKYKFCPLRSVMPEDVKLQAELAIAKTGLMTGGVDVLWDGRVATVLEINTAPYIGGNTADIYAREIKAYLDAA